MSFTPQEQKLLKLGWNAFFHAQLTAEELQTAAIARIVEPLRGLSRAACIVGEIWAEGPQNVGVGDWVIGTLRDHGGGEKRMAITRVLDRKTKLSRAAPSQQNYEQILCANADVVFIVLAMTQELNLAALARAIEASRAGELRPVIVLTKAATCENPSLIIDPVTKAAGEIPVHVVSIVEGKGAELLTEYFSNSSTVVLLGASGAGKSTLTNHFLETDAQLVGDTRKRDEKGRHTTTSRRLNFLPSGGMIVDSPGIRELQPWVPLAPKPEPSKKARKPKRSHQRYEDDE